MTFDENIMDERDVEIARHLDSLTLGELADLETTDHYTPVSCDGSVVRVESQIQRRRRPCS